MGKKHTLEVEWNQSGYAVYCFYLNNGIVFYLNKSSHLKVSIQLLMYTILKRITFFALGVHILYLMMVMQPCSKDTFNNVTVSFK